MGAMKTIAICLILFILVAVVAVVLGVVFFSKLPPNIQGIFSTPQQPGVKINYTSLTLDARASQGKEIAADYVLKQGDVKIASGQVIPSRVEAYNQIIRNVTYDLYTSSSSYYLGHASCNAMTSSICQTSNDQIGGMDLETQQVNGNQYRLTLNIENGTIRNPVWCFAWTPGIYYVTLPLKDYPVPNYLKDKEDRCFVEAFSQAVTYSQILDVYFYGSVSNDRLEITVYDLVQFLDSNGVLREELMYQNQDLGTKNTQATISFSS